MEQVREAGDLGSFAKETGRYSRAAVAALVLAGVATAFSLLRPILRLVGSSADPSLPGRAASAVGAAAVALGLVAMYLVSSRALRGQGLARLAVGLGAAAGIFAFFYAAVANGTLHPSRFVTQYFDMSINARLWPDLLRGLVVTIKLAVVAEVFAIFVGLIVSTFVLSPNPLLHYPAVGYVDVVRGLPLVVLTYLIYFGLPYVGVTLGDFVAPVLILTINASAYCAEIFRSGIQSLPRGQTDAARSLGMPHSTTLVHVIVPQAVRAVIPPLVSEFIALIKDTAIVILSIGFTAATADVFGAAKTASSSTFSPTPLMSAAFVYLLLTIPLARVVGRLERRVRARLA